MHKFNTDGTLASSWHPWMRDGKRQLPIQEDETGLPLWALWRHFERHHDVEFLTPYYKGMVRPAAEFMSRHIDEHGLPKPSYDLWEERWGVHAWTVAATWAGLIAAARFFRLFGDDDLAGRIGAVAGRMREAALTHFWHEDEQRFLRTLYLRDDGGYDSDLTVDASVCGLFLFGMFEADDPKVVSTVEHVRQKLWVPTDVGGVARYEHDVYQRDGDDGRVPGNPWFIGTLWLAQWQIARAKSDDDVTPAMELMRWCVKRALPSGVLAEQVDPYTDAPLSVSPLTWSHAEFVRTALAYTAKSASFQSCPVCGQPRAAHA
jgi:GH15 family glucan-1,4-alpha-glucosidase